MTGTPSRSASADIDAVFRHVYGQAVATLVRVFGDISLAEDAVQDAFVVAGDRWPTDGVPPNPAGWIVTTARRRAIDSIRRSARGRDLESEAARSAEGVAADDGEKAVSPVHDDQLRLIFTCCHPSLRVEHQVALTLRLLGGLSVAETARAFLVTESAMAKRLTRAKYKIKAARIPYRVPKDADLPDRLHSVLTVLYLIFTTGAGDRGRAVLRRDAIRLARSLLELMPDEPEAAGLVALMLLSESRSDARIDGGNIIVLRDQDRSSWNHTLIDEGQEIVRRCVRRNRPGPFQLQAAIQAVHADAATFEATDWKQIVTLYDHLYALMPTAIVALNRAIALGELEGPGTALEALAGLADDLDGYYLYHATLGSFRLEVDDRTGAEGSFQRAQTLAPTETDRRFLAGRIEAARAGGG